MCLPEHIYSIQLMFCDCSTTSDYKVASTVANSVRKENRLLSSEALEQLCADTSQELAVTRSEADLIEECTRNQASSAAWHEQRRGRITASVAHAAMHTDPRAPSRSVLQRICGPPVTELRVPAVLWGKQDEHHARQLYSYTHGEQEHLRIKPVGQVFMTEPTLHDTTFLSKSGLVVSTERPFLGASPDGIIQCSCCGRAGDQVPTRVEGGTYQHRARHSCVLS